MTLSLAGFPARPAPAVRPIGQLSIVPFVAATLAVLSLLMVAAPVPTTGIYMSISPGTLATTRMAPVYVSIDGKNRIFVSFRSGRSRTELRPATLESMGGLVASSLDVANPTSELVFVRASQRVKYGAFMSVVSRLQADGYTSIGLIGDEMPDN